MSIVAIYYFEIETGVPQPHDVFITSLPTRELQPVKTRAVATLTRLSTPVNVTV